MITVRNLKKNYGPIQAVRDISFDVEAGSIVGFLGPNGAGKSTTIRILTCYHPATSGKATVADFDVFSQSVEVRRRVGYLPESAPLYPEMRVREYLKFRGRLHGLSPEDRKRAIERVSRRCWLADFIDRPIAQLSKGMRQRVGLADSMLHDPKVLILDEPTVGLDPTQIQKQRELIHELGQDHTILFSSHTLSEVEKVCSHVIIIAGGKIVAAGRPEDLRQKVQAGSQLIAEVSGQPERLRQEIRRLHGVRAIETMDGVQPDASGWTRVRIDSDPGSDIREALFQMAVTSGFKIRELRREVASLEDYFVRITLDQQGAQ